MYVNGGGADLIASHQLWASVGDDDMQVSKTFSSQIMEFCSENNHQCLMISFNKFVKNYESGLFKIQQITRKNYSGWRYHYNQFTIAFRLLFLALRHRSDVILFDSGVTHYFILAIFRFFSINIIIILHNSLWPVGFRPRGRVASILLKLNGLYWRFLRPTTLVVSPAIKRQVEEVSSCRLENVIEFRAQFNLARFASIPDPPSFQSAPFTVMFVGRATYDKGVLDLPKIAAYVENALPGRVRWIICGDGPELEVLRNRVINLGLANLFDIRGYAKPKQIIQLYAITHAVIVPTRSCFSEGLAMTAIEPILAHRPVITSGVVPALELVGQACIESITDDHTSYGEAIVRLVTDKTLYSTLCMSTHGLAKDFTNSKYGLKQALEVSLGDTHISEY
jgi:glycogen synthase